MTVYPFSPVPAPGDAPKVPGCRTAVAPDEANTPGATPKHRTYRRGRLQPLDHIPARTPATRITTRWNRNDSSPGATT